MTQTLFKFNGNVRRNFVFIYFQTIVHAHSLNIFTKYLILIKQCKKIFFKPFDVHEVLSGSA